MKQNLHREMEQKGSQKKKKVNEEVMEHNN